MTDQTPPRKILILCADSNSANDIEALSDSQTGLQMERSRNVRRSLEATVIVALVSASSASIGALISGILKVAAEKQSKHVVMQGRSGRRIEVPSHLPPDQIREYIRLVQELDIDRIELQ